LGELEDGGLVILGGARRRLLGLLLGHGCGPRKGG
jgi:hypothetical protein